jgi:ribonuclease HI
MGVCDRDSEGTGILAGCGRLRAVHDALAAEGEACLAALYAARNVGISQVMVESDSLMSISAIRSST